LWGYPRCWVAHGSQRIGGWGNLRPELVLLWPREGPAVDDVVGRFSGDGWYSQTWPALPWNWAKMPVNRASCCAKSRMSTRALPVRRALQHSLHDSRHRSVGRHEEFPPRRLRGIDPLATSFKGGFYAGRAAPFRALRIKDLLQAVSRVSSGRAGRKFPVCCR